MHVPFYRITVSFETALFQTRLHFNVATRIEINDLRAKLAAKYPDADIHVDFQTIDHVMSVDDIVHEVKDEFDVHYDIRNGI